MSISAQRLEFRALYEEHYAFVWAVLRKMGVPDHDVEDLLQDTFVIVHRRLDAFEGRASFTTWLYAIVVRVYWNYARRQKSRPSLASISGTSLSIADPKADPEKFTEQQRASLLLERILGELDVDKRTAFVLAEIEGLTAPEIARVTGVKTRTIYSRLRAAKEQVEASAKRVVARERNDLVVRQLAARSTRRPPPELQRRAWLVVAARIAPAPVPVAPWLSLKTIGLSVAGLGLVGVVGVTAGASEPASPDPEPVAASANSAAKPEHRAPGPVVLPEPSAAEPAQPASPLPEVPVAAASVAKPQGAPARSRPTAPASSPPKAKPSSDVTLLRDARNALKTDKPAAALRMLERHGREFPKSQLAHERDRTKLIALCRVGKEGEATKLAARLGSELPAQCGASTP